MNYWLHMFTLGWGANFTVYAILQVGALAVLRGRNRLYALIPLPIMLFVAFATARAYRAGSMNWPVLMSVLGAWAALGLAVLLFRGVRAERHRYAKAIEYVTVALLVGSFLLTILRIFGLTP